MLRTLGVCLLFHYFRIAEAYDYESETFDLEIAQLWEGDDQYDHNIEKRDAHSDDFVLTPDVIFLFQRSGVSVSDFGYIKKFVGMSVYCLRDVADTDESSRISMSLFTEQMKYLIDYWTCCNENRSALLKMVDKTTMFDQTIITKLDQGSHSSVTPHNINIKTAFRIIRARYLRDDVAMRKPTLIVFVANFQTPYQSFRLFLEAVPDVEKCKSAGAWLTVIIVDPEMNRQPRLQESDVRLSRDAWNMMRSKDEGSSILLHHLRPSKDYVLQDHVEFIRQLDKVQRNFLQKIEELHRERSGDQPMEYNQLALLYAKVLASHKDDGFKISYYSDLVRHPVFTAMKRLLTKPTTWFGEGEISSSCPDTKHFLERTIWSPGFFDFQAYPENSDCEWHIKARKDFILNLKFDYLHTEDMFDYVLIYDGFDQDPHTLLGNYSGDYTEVEPLLEVNSTEEEMLVRFKADSGHTEVGFHATWTPYAMPDRIDDAEVVYLVDVSASLYEKDLEPVKRWVKKATKYFYFKGKPESPRQRLARLGILEEPKGTHFGLVTFDVINNILSSVLDLKSRIEFYEKVNNINHTMGSTYLGHALDFSRLRQFYRISGTDIPFPADARATNDINKDKQESDEKIEIPRRILFLFTDAHSVDNPSRAARRLCQADIVPVFIGIGRVNKEGKSMLTSYCGLAFDIDNPVGKVIRALKHHLGLFTNETTTLLPPLPTKGTFPTRIRFTKASTTTKTTTTTTPKPFYVRQTLKPQPDPRPITYFYFAGPLAAIGLCELVAFLATLYYHYCTASVIYTRPSDSEESIELEEDEFGKKAPKPFPEYPTTKNSFFDRHAAPFPKLIKKLANAESEESDDKAHCCEKAAKQALEKTSLNKQEKQQ